MLEKRKIFPVLQKQEKFNYLEILKHFPKCLDKKKIKIEITNSPEKYEEENISYQTYGT